MMRVESVLVVAFRIREKFPKKKKKKKKFRLLLLVFISDKPKTKLNIDIASIFIGRREENKSFYRKETFFQQTKK